MRNCILFLLLSLLSLCLQGQNRQLHVDTFVVVANGQTYSLNGPAETSGPYAGAYKRGANYVIKAWIYPGNYLEENCPTTLDCGVVINANGEAEPEDTTIIIGDWDCRGFFTVPYSTTDTIGATFDNNIQTFRFYDKPGSPCPGCVIVTEGGVTVPAVSGSEPNIWSDRTIIGGTGTLKYIRGDLSVINYAHLDEQNVTGCCNSTHILRYELVEGPLQFGKKLDVSVNGLSLIFDEPNDTSSSYGATIVLEGVVYPPGTFDDYGSTSGMLADGTPQLAPIGKWNCRGWWFSEDQDYNPSEGLFSITQQTFQFDDPVLGPVQIMTEGKDFIGLNETVEKMVTGATDALKGHRGSCMETLVGVNASNGFNFTFDFDTRQVVGIKDAIDKANSISMTVFPNPARDMLYVALTELESGPQYSLQIADATGRLVDQQTFSATSEKQDLYFNISTQPEGWYALVLKREGLVVGSKNFSKIK